MFLDRGHLGYAAGPGTRCARTSRPREQRDASRERPQLTKDLLARVDAWAAQADSKGAEHDLDSEVSSRLEALGYVDEPEPGD